MSIFSVVAISGEYNQRQTEPAARAAAADVVTQRGAWMEQITAFIPSEVVTIYLGGLGLLSPNELFWKWGLFLGGALLIPIFIFIDVKILKKANKPTPSLGKSVGLTIFALLAFTAWAGAMPETPFLSLWTHAQTAAAAAVLILAAGMYKFAALCGLVPSRDKEA